MVITGRAIHAAFFEIIALGNFWGVEATFQGYSR